MNMMLLVIETFSITLLKKKKKERKKESLLPSQFESHQSTVLVSVDKCPTTKKP